MRSVNMFAIESGGVPRRLIQIAETKSNDTT